MTLWHNLRIAARAWRQTPALAAIVVLTLALGVGATTTAFSLAYSVLVRPLPFPQADRLVWITSYNTRTSDGSEVFSNSNRMSQFLDWQQHLTSFEQLAAWGGAAPDNYTVTGIGTPERLTGLEVTQQLLPMLGAQPAAGRLFHEGDDDNGAPKTVVLSYGYWQRRFGARADAIGRSITVDNEVRAIVGVMAPDFPLSGSLFAGAPIDLYVPLERNPALDDIGAYMVVLGRLRPGATLEQARSELAIRQAALASQPKREWMATGAQQVTPLSDLVIRDARSPLLLLLGGIGCVLLMVCVNLANLLLVRASGRRREMQLRTALGATMRQVLRQTLMESAVLTMAGSVGAVVIAAGLTRIIRTASWLNLARLAEVEVGWTAIAFALAAGTVTTLVFGSLPLLHLRRHDVMDALRQSSGVSTDLRAAHAQRLSLVGQVAFALLLTVTGGLLFRSFTGLLAVDPGFQAENVVAVRIDPAGRILPPARAAFFSQVLESVRGVPGIESAALAIGVPMDRHYTFDVRLPGETPDPRRDVALARMVSPGYFRTVGIRTIAGRDFESRDELDAPLVVAISETLARRISATGRQPLGTEIVVTGRMREVVAVVADVRSRDLSTDAGAEVYIPSTQAPGWQAYDLVYRAAGDPLALVPAVREAVWTVDRNQAVGAPVALQQLVDRTIRPHRVLSWLLGGFAATALLLAALGVYGIVGYRVAQRTKELAIRVALGAPRWRVTWTVVRDTFTFVAIGLAVGFPLTLVAGTAVSGFLFGVEARDTATIAAACAAVLAAALTAAYLPARRAPRVDPITALRAD